MKHQYIKIALNNDIRRMSVISVRLHRLYETLLTNSNKIVVLLIVIVRLMSQCKRIFGDTIFTFCPIKLKLTSIIGRFQTNFGATFHSILQRVKNFPRDPRCKNCPHSETLQRFRKRAIFTMGVYGETLLLLSNPDEISPQSSSKTLK